MASMLSGIGAPILIIARAKDTLVKSRGSVGVRDMQNRNWIQVLPLAILFALQATTQCALLRI
jgi:hypothetical protein